MENLFCIFIHLWPVKIVSVWRHLHSADISVTAEIIIDVIDGELTKEFDEETGANLFKFD